MKLEYILNDDKNGLVVTGGKDLEGELTIPSEDCFEGKTYPVIAIGGTAFCKFSCKCSALTSIEIPDSVTKIGDWAFWCCEGLTSVVIPDSVTKIGQGAFTGCSALTSIIVDKDNRHYDSREECNAIIESDTNTLVAGCSTTVIPDSVTEIGTSAFVNCKGLTSIRIPDSVTKIGEGAFSGCSALTSIIVDKENEHYDSREECNAIIESDTNTLVAGCSTTIIPDSVTKIGDWAFEYCSALTSIVIPNSITKVGQGAFLGCLGLTSIIVDKENEHYNSREECNAIIESDTNTLVAGCSTTVIPDSVTKIGNDAFCGCENMTSIQIPDSVTEIGKRAFCKCKGLLSIIIPNSVTKIGNDAFCGCERLTSIEIPNSVTEIGNYVFCGCEKLTSIQIPDSVTEIGERAFADCSGLTSIEIPNSVTKIGDWAFSRCKGLTSIVISDASLLAGTRVPEGVKIIKPFTATRRMLYNPATIDMPDNNGEIILSGFLSDNGIHVPDNQTPDSEMGAVIKQDIVKITKVDPEKVVNEASLSADLHMTFFQFMRLLGKMNKTFHLNSAILEARTKVIRKLVAKDIKNSKNFPLVLPTVGELTAFYEWMSKTDRGYLAFNMKEALHAVRERIHKEVEENKWFPDGFIQNVNNIHDDIAVEELLIYRDYLSKFTPGPFFRDKLLLTTADDRISKDDGDLFFKMVCGSFGFTYDLVFNEEWQKWELTVHHEDEEGCITKKIYKLNWLPIKNLFPLLLYEYLMQEDALKKDNRYITDRMQKRIEVFKQKMQVLEAKYNPNPIHDKDIDIDAELDKLLNS